jgi:uncharacterized protein YlxP (DUF503 family)
MEIDLHLPACRSLKAKRAVLRPIVEGLRGRFRVSVAEVGDQDLWQRANIGVAVVGATTSHVVDVMDEIERWIWAQPGVEVVSMDRTWMEE